MPNTVVYVMDFGHHQRLAQPCLTRLRDAGYGDLVLLHVINEPRTLRGIQDLLKEDIAGCVRLAAERRMDEWAQECGRMGLPARSFLLSEHIEWLAICDLARREGASLVVVGPRVGPDPGPTTYFVMHAITADLLILKIAGTSGQPYDDECRSLFRRVLLPTDWSECAQRAERYVLRLRGAGVEEVIFTHVIEPGLAEARKEEHASHAERRLTHSARPLEEAGLRVRTLLLEGEPASTIVEVAERGDASLIVMGSTGKSVTEERLVGSISERVGLMSSRSVLLVH